MLRINIAGVEHAPTAGLTRCSLWLCTRPASTADGDEKEAPDGYVQVGLVGRASLGSTQYTLKTAFHLRRRYTLAHSVHACFSAPQPLSDLSEHVQWRSAVGLAQQTPFEFVAAVCQIVSTTEIPKIVLKDVVDVLLQQGV